MIIHNRQNRSYFGRGLLACGESISLMNVGFKSINICCFQFVTICQNFIVEIIKKCGRLLNKGKIEVD